MKKKYWVEIFLLLPEWIYEGFSYSPDLNKFESKAIMETFTLDKGEYILDVVLKNYPNCGYFMVHHTEEINFRDYRDIDYL